MEGQASILTTPYILGAIMVLAFLILGAGRLQLFPKKANKLPLKQPDLLKLDRPRRTGNYKFIEESCGNVVLYCEFEVWEMQEFLTGYKRTFWEIATDEDKRDYYHQKMLELNGRI